MLQHRHLYFRMGDCRLLVIKSILVLLSGVPEEFGSYAKNFDECIVETLNLYINLIVSQRCEICVPGRVLSIWQLAAPLGLTTTMSNIR
jgi:hypothetical protein